MVKFFGCQQRNDIVSLAAISAIMEIFLVWSYPTCWVASLRAGPVGCISYNMYTVQSLLKKHLYPLKIPTTFVQSQTSTSFPKFSKKLLPPAFNLTCLLTLCLLLLNLLTGSFILLKLLFLKFKMTSSLRWIVVRSLHSFFLTYLLPLILSIIPSFSLVFKISSVLMVFHLIGFYLISHLVLRQAQSMIRSLHSPLFPLAYPKVPYLAHYFLLFIQLLLARWSQKIPSNIICTPMTPSCSLLSYDSTTLPLFSRDYS